MGTWYTASKYFYSVEIDRGGSTMALQVSGYIAASMDGFIAGEDDGLEFLNVVAADGEDYGYARFMASVDTVVLGRRTYDVMTRFPQWPLTGKHVVVLTHRAISPSHGETAHQGALGPLFAALAAQGRRRVYLDGGRTLTAALAQDVLQDLTVSIIPVTLGAGIPLFAGGFPRRDWRLTAHHAYASGLVQLTWERARTATAG